MTNLSVNSTSDVLLSGPGKKASPDDKSIVKVAKNFGVSPLTQLKEIFSLRWGAQKLKANEYYDYRVFDPAFSGSAKREFLGQNGFNALNLAMNPASTMEVKNFVGSKLVYTRYLEKWGIPTTRTQVFIEAASPVEHKLVLKDRDAIVTFLQNDAEYPLFGKPHDGSLSIGSVRIDALDGDTLQLGSGAKVSLVRFAEDVLRMYPKGFILQSLLVQHADLTRIAGSAIGSIRVVTTHDGTAFRPAYALWKLPAPNAMSDNFWQAGSMLGMIDISQGTVVRCQRGTGLESESLQHHPETGEKIIGTTIPYWEEIIDTVVAAHKKVPELGICGFDVAVTQDGPKIIECNDNPNHGLYQLAARRGVRNPDMEPLWQSVIAWQKTATQTTPTFKQA